MKIHYTSIILITASELVAVFAGSLNDDCLHNKKQYRLFNPTPHELRRELSPERPDVTESACRVDAGHVAIEVSMFDCGAQVGLNKATEEIGLFTGFTKRF